MQRDAHDEQTSPTEELKITVRLRHRNPPEAKGKIEHATDRQDASQGEAAARSQQECGAKDVRNLGKWHLLPWRILLSFCIKWKFSRCLFQG